MTRRTVLILTLAALVGGLLAVPGACGSTRYVLDSVEEPLLPISDFVFTRRPYQPYSLKTRLAVINFVDQTNAAGQLVKTIPDVLTTGLYETQRFDILDRGQLREKSVNDLREEAGKLPVDGLLQGAITQIQPDEHTIICDIRVTNRLTEQVVYAKSYPIRYKGSLDVVLDRSDINKLSVEIAGQFPTMSEREEARVMEISSDLVTISAGSDKGIRAGMAALVVAPGDLKRDPASGEVLSSRAYVGLVMVISVNERSSRARIAANTNILVGDRVVFK